VRGLVRQAERAAEDEAAAREAVKGVNWTLLDAFDVGMALRLGRAEPDWEAFTYDPLNDDADRTQALIEAAAEESDTMQTGVRYRDGKASGDAAVRDADEAEREADAASATAGMRRSEEAVEDDYDGEDEDSSGALRFLRVGCSEVSALRPVARGVLLSGPVARYAREVATATRSHALLSRGASLDAEAMLVTVAKCRALLEAREFVTPDDVAKAAVMCLSHRMQVRSREEVQFLGVDDSVLDDSWLTGVPPSTARPRAVDSEESDGELSERTDDTAPSAASLKQLTMSAIKSAKDVIEQQILAILAQPSGMPVPTTVRSRA
jgi:hypothetical protein